MAKKKDDGSGARGETSNTSSALPSGSPSSLHFSLVDVPTAKLAAIGAAAASESLADAALTSFQAARERLETRLRFGPQYDRQKPSQPTENDRRQFDNILGMGYGTKVSGEGIDTGLPCIQVFVREKFGDSAHAGAAAIPEEIDGVPTDVVEIGEIELRTLQQRASGMQTQPQLPLQCGMGVGIQDRSDPTLYHVGTIGAVCHATVQGQLVSAFLSNNHVLALNDQVPNPRVSVRSDRPDGFAAAKQ